MAYDNRGSRPNGNYIPGLALIIVGVLFLIGGSGLFGWLGKFLWAGVFGVLAYLAYMEGQRTEKSFMRILAVPLAALAVVSLLPGRTGGPLFLAAIGLAFAFAWRRDPSRWWAIIPAGALGSVALEAALGPAQGFFGGSLFLLGMAATFFALTRLRQHAQAWAIYPAVALAVLAVLSFSGGAGWLVPLLLIVAGLVLLYRTGALGDVERTLRSGLGRRTDGQASGDQAGTSVTPPVVGTARPGAVARPDSPQATTSLTTSEAGARAGGDGDAAAGGTPYPNEPF
ncbi:MAG: hypothetical protein IT345_04890 [Trueperaceae bacterium]|nr:hypothetical protein [Trueperaceae bacterium]